jgi:hypothetical protein
LERYIVAWWKWDEIATLIPEAVLYKTRFGNVNPCWGETLQMPARILLDHHCCHVRDSPVLSLARARVRCVPALSLLWL